ncbi:MAG: TspO/MBR family protein [Vampirovibrionales bacterium]|nr:TspO/MBR family protein [Vampirovibrionales bacterium]
MAEQQTLIWKNPPFHLFLIWLAICLGIGVIEGMATSTSVATWYVGLEKPWFNPPDWIFAPVWTTLYVLMATAVWRIHGVVDNRLRQKAIALFCLQLFFNAAWSVLFFTWHLIAIALVDIVLLWGSLLWTMGVFYRRDKWAGILLLPYWLWVSFAVVLNWQLWILNPAG